MRCPHCGKENTGTEQRCRACGKPLHKDRRAIRVGGIIVTVLLIAGIIILAMLGKNVLRPLSAADREKIAQKKKHAEQVVSGSDTGNEINSGSAENDNGTSGDAGDAVTDGEENSAGEDAGQEIVNAPAGSIAGAEQRAKELKVAQEAGKMTAQLSDDKKTIAESGYLPVGIKSSKDSTNLGGKKYSAAAAVDGDEKTSWQEGDSGDGLGSELKYTLDGEYEIRYLKFKLGNWSSEKSYFQNNRPSKLTITAGGESAQVTFPDVQSEFTVKLSKDVKAKEVKIMVDQVYQGSKYSDTCISEIEIEGKKAAQQ